MLRNACFVVTALLFSASLYAGTVQISISLPAETFNRGASTPVEGLDVTLTVSNPSHIPILISKPDVHPAAAPAMAARAVIKRVDAGEGENKPIPAVGVRGNPYLTSKEVKMRLQPNGSEDVVLDVGRYYRIQDAGEYTMHIEFQGEKSNEVRFTVLPLRRVAMHEKILMERINDVEWGEPAYTEMFYVLSSQYAWDQIVAVYRLGGEKDKPLQMVGLGSMARKEMPEIQMEKPGVYVLLYKSQDGKGWTACKVNMSVDPLTTAYKRYKGEESPGLAQAVADLR